MSGGCSGFFQLDPTGDVSCEPNILDCENCYVSSYSPTPGTSFTISAWVKDEDASPEQLDYEDPRIEIDFGASSISFRAKGQIIDGWQRIHEQVDIPVGATYMVITLNALNGNVLFDDIRVQPDDASMKCYVYDPVTTRLVAEFDERHFATRYEYDAEGRLNRTKKETERGVMTIQEGRMSMPERQP